MGTFSEKDLKGKLNDLKMREFSTNILNSELAPLILNPVVAGEQLLQPHASDGVFAKHSLNKSVYNFKSKKALSGNFVLPDDFKVREKK